MFFKQKTAYEMRISDWSSDVCSSDLGSRTPCPNLLRLEFPAGAEDPPHGQQAQHEEAEDRRDADRHVHVRHAVEAPAEAADQVHHRVEQGDLLPHRRQHRSEEHTSELQSLMRISYAVFCLKKKKT